jgi:hypothetical protein
MTRVNAAHEPRERSDSRSVSVSIARRESRESVSGSPASAKATADKPGAKPR